MKLNSLHFFYAALAVTITAFIFSLFSYADSNPSNNNNPAPDVHSVNVQVTEGSGEDARVGSGESQKDVEGRIGEKYKQRITQTEDEHVKQGNGSMYAIDVVTESGDAYFPEKYKEYYIYFIGYDSRIGNYIIIRHDKERWVYGHTVTSRSKGEYVQSTGANNVLGQANKSGVSTAKHVHIERWVCPDKYSKMYACSNVSSTGQVAPRNKELKEQRGWVETKAQNNANKENGSVRQVHAGTGEVRVIACLNENDMTIHEAKGSGSTACFLGKGGKWKNIMLPPQKDLDKFKEIFGEDYKYRLTIANFEGSFREDNGNPYAHGYLQTLRSYKIPADITSQLNWLKKREIGTTGRICDLNGWNKTKLDRYVCMAGGHFGFFKPGDKHYAHSVMYKKRYKVVTEYYLSLNF